MKVWVVENGCYSDRYVVGVYDSIEAVIADNPVPESPRHRDRGDFFRPGGWQPEERFGDERESWSNGLDWEGYLRATCFEVNGLVAT